MDDEIIWTAAQYNVAHIHTTAINELHVYYQLAALTGPLPGAPLTFQRSFFMNERRRWSIYVTAGLPWPLWLTGPGGRGLAAQSTCRLAWEFHVRHRRLSANGNVIVSLRVCVSVCVCLLEYWTNNHRATARFDLVLSCLRAAEWCAFIRFCIRYVTDVAEILSSPSSVYTKTS